MIRHKAYKFRIYPNQEQQVYFTKAFGSVRFLYNKMLAERKELYELYKEDKEQLKAHKPKTYTEYKKENIWLYEVDSLALANAQINLQTAYSNFFRGKGKIGFPTFKSKHKDKDSYTTNNQGGNIRIENKHILLPKIKAVRIVQHREIPDNQTIKSVTVSRTRTNKYFTTILTEWNEEEKLMVLDTNRAIGLDFSMPHFFVDSQNNKGEYPKFYRQAQDKLSKEQRKLSHCKKGSNNWHKQKLRVALISEQISNRRKDWLNKLSCQIAKDNDIICLEDLNMKGMSQTLNFGKSVGDNGWGLFVNMLSYKAKRVIKVDKWYPSSKTCSHCGTNNVSLTLKERTWTCPICGALIDRDYNASQNILAEGLRLLKENINKETVGTTELAYLCLAQ